MLIHKFHLINTFYITLYPSVGVLRVSFFWNFDFVVFANSMRKERVIEYICSAANIAYFAASFGPNNVVWRQYNGFCVASKRFCPEFLYQAMSCAQPPSP
jgi:hypothetical protein